VNYCPSNLLSGLPPPPLTPFPKSKYSTVYQPVCGSEGVGGGGVLSFVGDHILQEFNTLFLTRFRTYTIALPPQKKTYMSGGGLRKINNCRKVPVQVNLYK
jgi:hypothetical protein